MRTILVTGFDFFDKYFVNTSGEVARILDGWSIRGEYMVRGFTLPVSLRAVKKRYPRLVEETMPAMILSLGLSPRAREVLLELASYNAAYFDSPDVEGYKAGFEAVEEEGGSILGTRLPVRRIIKLCRHDRMLPIRPSISIGTYLCNAAGYMAHLHAARLGVPGGFLHLPPHTELAMRSSLPGHRPLWEIVEAVKCVIESSLPGK